MGVSVQLPFGNCSFLDTYIYINIYQFFFCFVHFGGACESFFRSYYRIVSVSFCQYSFKMINVNGIISLKMFLFASRTQSLKNVNGKQILRIHLLLFSMSMIMIIAMYFIARAPCPNRTLICLSALLNIVIIFCSFSNPIMICSLNYQFNNLLIRKFYSQ